MKESKSCRVFVGSKPVIIIGDDEFYDVEVFIPGEKLVKNTGYIIGDYVYIYRGKLKDENTTVPGIYKTKGNEYTRIEPSKNEKHLYHIDNVNELEVDSIFDTIEKNKDVFIQPEDIEIINNNSEVYTPTIKESDDFLKYVIKKAIIDKKINLRNYKGRFANEYALNNMKSGLNKSTKMTVPNFIKWAEVLGFDWKLSIWDSGKDTVNPLPEPIEISSTDL